MPKVMRVDTVDDPRIEDAGDVILKVTSTAICGSDLHLYNGMFPQVKPMVMGHEFMGVVVETGADVKRLQKGDRVVVPFPIACGSCWFCSHGLHSSCEESNPHYGPEGGLMDEKGGALFGYTDLYGGYSGGQAEYVRVPFADVGPRKISDAYTDEQVLFLTDIFPTGYCGIQRAGLKGGETVAVVGCGPVGLMAMKCAWVMGAGKVIGLDIEDYRLAMAKTAANAEAIKVDPKDPEPAIQAIRDMTGGRGADVVVDAVGMEPHRGILEKAANILHLQKGSINALKICFSAVRRNGTVSILGVYGTPMDNFPISQVFDKGLTVNSGQALVQSNIDELIAWLDAGKIRLDDIITHSLPLEEAPHGYDIFNEKKEDCVKVVLKP
jgi:threonine dehydrogenase-like Zn-dependent dehydrogenase